VTSEPKAMLVWDGRCYYEGDPWYDFTATQGDDVARSARC
jgi:hypothetical protein